MTEFNRKYPYSFISFDAFLEYRDDFVDIEAKSLYYWDCDEQEYFREVYMGNPGYNNLHMLESNFPSVFL